MLFSTLILWLLSQTTQYGFADDSWPLIRVAITSHGRSNLTHTSEHWSEYLMYYVANACSNRNGPYATGG